MPPASDQDSNGMAIDPPLNVVLIEPEIPPNTGSVGRLCLATGSRLHLVGPLGFSLDERALRRAGLDYWDQVDVRHWASLDHFLNGCGAPGGGAAGPRFHFLTTKADRSCWDADFQPGDFLVFGRETRGLPEALLASRPECCLAIPMRRDSTRSLNLATAVAAVLYEAARQITTRRVPGGTV